MNFGEWKAQLIEKPGFAGYELYLYRNLPGEIHFISQTGDVTAFKEGEKRSDVPFATLTYDQLHTIADAFANKGVKTTNDHRNAGLLEATKAHLEDMRRLVFTPEVEHVVYEQDERANTELNAN